MAVDKHRADAIVQAILQPVFEEQEKLRLRHEFEANRLLEQRRRASFGLVGFAIGAAVGYFADGRISYFGLMGGFIGVLLSWLTKPGAA